MISVQFGYHINDSLLYAYLALCYDEKHLRGLGAERCVPPFLVEDTRWISPNGLTCSQLRCRLPLVERQVSADHVLRPTWRAERVALG